MALKRKAKIPTVPMGRPSSRLGVRGTLRARSYDLPLASQIRDRLLAIVG
jgi:hypothetical protein